MFTETLTSARNPKVKMLEELSRKSSLRRETGLFVVEGRREIEHCLEGGYELDSVFVCEGFEDYVPQARQTFLLSKEVYEKLAYRQTTEGILAEVKSKSLSLEDLVLPDNPLLVVLESVEKPGNLGAVLRSADAAGADAVIVCDPLTDLYNPNLIRASLGARFTVPCLECAGTQAIDFLKSRGIAILTAQLQDSELYYDCDMTRGVAIVMGTESTGLTQSWRDAADAHIRIPMNGRLDSLNVSVSAAILLYEAVRQRNV